MRLFIAINFTEMTKKQLGMAVEKLKKISDRGNFTPWANYHLTLKFIGESCQLDRWTRCLDSIEAAPFKLYPQSIGKFNRQNKDLYWVGFKNNENILFLYKDLQKYLVEEGNFAPENLFMPHMTIGRGIVIKNNTDITEIIDDTNKKLQEIVIDVDSASLMLSETKKYGVVYSELYKKYLNNNQIKSDEIK